MAEWLYLVAGPNAIGKSTWIETEFRTQNPDVPVIDIDAIDVDLPEGASLGEVHAARRQAAYDWAGLMVSGGRSVLLETLLVRSQPEDLVALARSSGLCVSLTLLTVADPEAFLCRAEARHGVVLAELQREGRRGVWRDGLATFQKLAPLADAWEIWDAVNRPAVQVAKGTGDRITWMKSGVADGLPDDMRQWLSER